MWNCCYCIQRSGEHILISWWTVMLCRGFPVQTSESFHKAGGWAGWQWCQIFELDHIFVYCRTCDEHVSIWLWTFFPCALHLRGSIGSSFAMEFWGWVVLYSIVLLSMMLFKCSVKLTRNLFISYVHKHDCLGFAMLTVETAVIDCIRWFGSGRDRSGQSYPVECYLESVEEYSEGKIHKSELEPGNGNVNTMYFVN